MSEVLLIKTNDRKMGMEAIYSHYKSKFTSFEGKSVAIKPNFNTADPPPASTDIEMIRSMILHLKENQVKSITVAERSGPADTEETMESKGLYKLQEELNFNIINFSSMTDENWVHLKPEKSHWKDGYLFAKPILEADIVIAMACLKTHQFGGHFTLALKLAVGNLPRKLGDYMSELHSSPHQRKLIAEINQSYNPSLVILDGVDAFVKGGPSRGDLVHPHVMLASTDRIAIDAVGVAVLRDLGTTPEVEKGAIFDQEQIKRAVELDLGVKTPEDITIVGFDSQSQEYADHLSSMLNNTE